MVWEHGWGGVWGSTPVLDRPLSSRLDITNILSREIVFCGVVSRATSPTLLHCSSLDTLICSHITIILNTRITQRNNIIQETVQQGLAWSSSPWSWFFSIFCLEICEMLCIMVSIWCWLCTVTDIHSHFCQLIHFCTTSTTTTTKHFYSQILLIIATDDSSLSNFLKSLEILCW